MTVAIAVPGTLVLAAVLVWGSTRVRLRGAGRGGRPADLGRRLATAREHRDARERDEDRGQGDANRAVGITSTRRGARGCGCDGTALGAACAGAGDGATWATGAS